MAGVSSAAITFVAVAKRAVGTENLKLFRQEKGHAQELSAFINAIQNGVPAPIDLSQLLEVSEFCIRLNELVVSKR